MGNQSSIQQALATTNIDDLQDVFNKIATGRSTTDKGMKIMTQTDFTKQFPMLASRDLFGDTFFSVFDLDHSGEIEFAEFFAGLKIVTMGDSNSKIDALFRLLDAEGKGYIEEPQTLIFVTRAIAMLKSIDETMFWDPRPEREALLFGSIRVKTDPREVADGAYASVDKAKPVNSASGRKLTQREFRLFISNTPQLLIVVEYAFTFSIIQDTCKQTRIDFIYNIEREIGSKLPMEESDMISLYTSIMMHWGEVLQRRLNITNHLSSSSLFYNDFQIISQYKASATAATNYSTGPTTTNRKQPTSQSNQPQLDFFKLVSPITFPFTYHITDITLQSSSATSYTPPTSTIQSTPFFQAGNGGLISGQSGSSTTARSRSNSRVSANMTPLPTPTASGGATQAGSPAVTGIPSSSSSTSSLPQRRNSAADISKTVLGGNFNVVPSNQATTSLFFSDFQQQQFTTSFIRQNHQIDSIAFFSYFLTTLKLHDLILRNSIASKTYCNLILDTIRRDLNTSFINPLMDDYYNEMQVEMEQKDQENAMIKSFYEQDIHKSAMADGKSSNDSTNPANSSTSTLRSSEKLSDMSDDDDDDDDEDDSYDDEDDETEDSDSREDAARRQKLFVEAEKNNNTAKTTTTSVVTKSTASTGSALAPPAVSKPASSSIAAPASSRDSGGSAAMPAPSLSRNSSRRASPSPARVSVSESSRLSSSNQQTSTLTAQELYASPSAQVREGGVNSLTLATNSLALNPSMSAANTPSATNGQSSFLNESMIPVFISTLNEKIHNNYLPFARGPSKMPCLEGFIQTYYLDTYGQLISAYKLVVSRRVKQQISEEKNAIIMNLRDYVNELLLYKSTFKAEVKHQLKTIQKQQNDIDLLHVQLEDQQLELSTLREQNNILKTELTDVISVKDMAIITLRDELQFFAKENQQWADTISSLHQQLSELRRDRDEKSLEVAKLRAQKDGPCTIM